MYGTRYEKVSPVKEGDIIDVKIEAIGEKGDGIAKINGFVLIIPNTSKDDLVKVKITKVLKKVGFGEVVGKSDAKPAIKEKKENIRPMDEEAIEPEYFSADTANDSEDFGEEN